MTTRQDFTIDAGRDYGVLVSLFEADGTTELNLLDCELAWIVTAAPGNGVELIRKSSLVPAEIEITSIGEGKLTIWLQPIDTDELGALTLAHELVVVDASGDYATVMKGLLTIMRAAVN